MSRTIIEVTAANVTTEQEIHAAGAFRPVLSLFPDNVNGSVTVECANNFRVFFLNDQTVIVRDKVPPTPQEQAQERARFIAFLQSHNVIANPYTGTNEFINDMFRMCKDFANRYLRNL